MARTSPSLSYPMFPEDAAAVTPSDTVTFVGIQAGGVIPVRVRRVYSTDTTATGFVRVF